jgi:hypothetical protein
MFSPPPSGSSSDPRIGWAITIFLGGVTARTAFAVAKKQHQGEPMSRWLRFLPVLAVILFGVTFILLAAVFDLAGLVTWAYTGLPARAQGLLIGVVATVLLERARGLYWQSRLRRREQQRAMEAIAKAESAAVADRAAAAALAVAAATASHETVLRLRGLYMNTGKPALRAAMEFLKEEIIATAASKGQAIVADMLGYFVFDAVKIEKEALEINISAAKTADEQLAAFKNDLAKLVLTRYNFLLYWLRRGGEVVLGSGDLTSRSSYAAMHTQHTIFLGEVKRALDSKWPELHDWIGVYYELCKALPPPSLV